MCGRAVRFAWVNLTIRSQTALDLTAPYLTDRIGVCTRIYFYTLHPTMRSLQTASDCDHIADHTSELET